MKKYKRSKISILSRNSILSININLHYHLQSVVQKKFFIRLFKFVYLQAAGWFANELALAWIHDRVPRQVEPLPDLWFSIFPEVRGAIHVTEYIMLFLVVNALIVVICHQHRWIVMRRVFFCAALAYAFRAICITLLQVCSNFSSFVYRIP